MENRPIITCLRMRFVIGTVIGLENMSAMAIRFHIIGVHSAVMYLRVTHRLRETNHMSIRQRLHFEVV